MVKDITTEETIKKNIFESNKNLINSNPKVTSLNKNSKININFKVSTDYILSKKQKSHSNKGEGKKFSEKKNPEKIKFEDIKEKTINLNYNINEILGNKKSNDQIKQLYQSSANLNEINNNKNKKNHSTNKNKVINKKTMKIKNLNCNVNSPDKIIIKINNIGSHHPGTKNKNFQKKIHKNNTNTNVYGLNSNELDLKKINNLNNKKKYTLNNNTDYSPNTKKKKSSKISSKKKYIINVKHNNNSSSKNSSNSKKNNSNNQISNKKAVKVESINIDLNLGSTKKKKNYNSQNKLNKDNPLNDKKNLTLRQTEMPKYSSKFNYLHKHMELSLNHPNESTDLDHSFKTAFSLTKKTRSLSKKRDEKKKMNWFKFGEINDEEENKKKLDDILLNLSNQKNVGKDYKNNVEKSEPKKLIDRIRKAKKIQKT